ncbi:unnamed protein product [Spirodela intermedia]|uniref:Dof-type domain-containing protein n=1 Tax=Spirodela intermedia TaxID=51605 RepID=A0A7I8IVA2_SPIIN|nr:unnamed protein product [Spirodela intermedia]CAA6661916.1 unnamed protein product [Spirodela intermedia]
MICDPGGRCGTMVQGKDPAIKLFGRTIPVVGRRAVGGADLPLIGVFFFFPGWIQRENKCSAKEALLEEPHGRDQIESNLPFVEEKEHGEADGSVQEKTLKRPDKILPCPRCNSLDTKFCYYNNYNVNQPRHFCKNCQRYWTAGGTMRNVPVGAGRRRSKPSPPPELVPRRFPAWGSSHGAGLELGPAEMASSESGTLFMASEISGEILRSIPLPLVYRIVKNPQKMGCEVLSLELGLCNSRHG